MGDFFRFELSKPRVAQLLDTIRGMPNLFEFALEVFDIRDGGDKFMIFFLVFILETSIFFGISLFTGSISST
jgi:hypothetical protein